MDSPQLFEFHPIHSSPHLPNGRNGDQQGGSSHGQDGICKHPLVPLFWCNNKQYEFECGVCRGSSGSTSYYACLQCEKQFHKECAESPLEIRHPSHPIHSLLLTFNGSSAMCICCRVFSRLFYHCATCGLSMNPVCAMRTIPFVEDHPKSHPHPLTFFPTQASLVCHICGQTKNLDPTFICIQCTFVIHKGCIGYPHVIRISRHHHRVSFVSSSLPPGKLPCRICHQNIGNHYGAYSCSKCDDAYFVHTKCALHRKIWDGIDLDGVPEEDDAIDDGEPFQRIANGIILHPFHSHNLRLEIFKAFDEKKVCRGCALPIYEGQFYSCLEVECDFILHEGCANTPRMKRHPLHPSPLTLKVPTVVPEYTASTQGIFECVACKRIGTGLFYEHNSFMLDLRCASITDPYQYQGHEHPLYLPLDTEEKSRCHTCDYKSYESKLRCFECDYNICFRCVTFPYKARYKHEDHFLTIRDGKKAGDQVEWCEICEGKIEEVKERAYQSLTKKEVRFYRCDECSMALHIDCLLGIDMNMIHFGNTRDYCIYIHHGAKIQLNISLSRPICGGCDRRCPFPIVFRGETNTAFCSWYCVDL